MTGETKLNKNHDLSVVILVRENQQLGGGFCHRLDALGAEHFMHFMSLFHHQRLLQVRFERAVGGMLGEGATVPEGGGFSTICAFSHFKTSFLAIIPSVTSTNCLFRRHDILSRHLLTGKMLK